MGDEAVAALFERLAALGWPSEPVAVCDERGRLKTDEAGRYESTLRLLPCAMPDSLLSVRIRANDGCCVPVVTFDVVSWRIEDGAHAVFARFASTAHMSKANGTPRSPKTARMMENAKSAILRQHPACFTRDPDEWKMPFGIVFATRRLPDGNDQATARAAADQIASWSEAAVPWFSENWPTQSRWVPTEETCREP